MGSTREICFGESSPRVVVLDTSGSSSNHGTNAAGTMNYVTGRNSTRALTFNGVNDYIQIPRSIGERAESEFGAPIESATFPRSSAPLFRRRNFSLEHADQRLESEFDEEERLRNEIVSAAHG